MNFVRDQVTLSPIEKMMLKYWKRATRNRKEEKKKKKNTEIEKETQATKAHQDEINKPTDRPTDRTKETKGGNAKVFALIKLCIYGHFSFNFLIFFFGSKIIVNIFLSLKIFYFPLSLVSYFVFFFFGYFFFPHKPINFIDFCSVLSFS